MGSSTYFCTPFTVGEQRKNHGLQRTLRRFLKRVFSLEAAGLWRLLFARRACAGYNRQTEAVHCLDEDLFVRLQRHGGDGSPDLALVLDQCLALPDFDDDGAGTDHGFFTGRPRFALRLKDFQKNRKAPDQDRHIEDQRNLPSEDEEKTQGQDGQQKDQMLQGTDLRAFQEMSAAL